MIKNGKRIQPHRRPFCMPKHGADLCMRMDLQLDKKTVENQDWATGPSRATGPLGPRAVMGGGPLGHGPAFSKTHRIHDLFYY